MTNKKIFKLIGAVAFCGLSPLSFWGFGFLGGAIMTWLLLMIISSALDIIPGPKKGRSGEGLGNSGAQEESDLDCFPEILTVDEDFDEVHAVETNDYVSDPLCSHLPMNIYYSPESEMESGISDFSDSLDPDI